MTSFEFLSRARADMKIAVPPSLETLEVRPTRYLDRRSYPLIRLDRLDTTDQV